MKTEPRERADARDADRDLKESGARSKAHNAAAGRLAAHMFFIVACWVFVSPETSGHYPVTSPNDLVRLATRSSIDTSGAAA